MNNRLKELRKRLKLSQADFGDKLYLSQNQVSLLENGSRKITDRSIHTICEKFDVNEEWLRTGEGDMFIDLTKDLDASDDIKNMIKKILTLEPKDQEKIAAIIDKFL